MKKTNSMFKITIAAAVFTTAVLTLDSCGNSSTLSGNLLILPPSTGANELSGCNETYSDTYYEFTDNQFIVGEIEDDEKIPMEIYDYTYNSETKQFYIALNTWYGRYYDEDNNLQTVTCTCQSQVLNFAEFIYPDLYTPADNHEFYSESFSVSFNEVTTFSYSFNENEDCERNLEAKIQITKLSDISSLLMNYQYFDFYTDVNNTDSYTGSFTENDFYFSLNSGYIDISLSLSNLKTSYQLYKWSSGNNGTDIFTKLQGKFIDVTYSLRKTDEQKLYVDCRINSIPETLELESEDWKITGLKELLEGKTLSAEIEQEYSCNLSKLHYLSEIHDISTKD